MNKHILSRLHRAAFTNISCWYETWNRTVMTECSCGPWGYYTLALQDSGWTVNTVRKQSLSVFTACFEVSVLLWRETIVNTGACWLFPLWSCSHMTASAANQTPRDIEWHQIKSNLHVFTGRLHYSCLYSVRTAVQLFHHRSQPQLSFIFSSLQCIFSPAEDCGSAELEQHAGLQTAKCERLQ